MKTNLLKLKKWLDILVARREIPRASEILKRAIRRDPGIINTRIFIDLACGPIGQWLINQNRPPIWRRIYNWFRLRMWEV